MCKENKNYAAAATYLEGLDGPFTVWEVQLLWCREILRRKLGNRLKSAKALGITIRTLRYYMIVMREYKMDVPVSDPRGWDKPKIPNWRHR